MRWRPTVTTGLLPGTLGAAILLQALSGGWAVANLPAPEPASSSPVPLSAAGVVASTPPSPPSRRSVPPLPRATPLEEVPAAPTPHVSGPEEPSQPSRTAPPPPAPVDLRPIGDLLGGLLPVVGSARLVP
ncbi:MAG: hypothetical protein M3N68_01585 [Actinomycetota bacterium]|nr:hypothetical protein [Actinomycetota bacterium]